MEQVTGIEPAYQPWEGCVLPLNYTCICSYFITDIWLITTENKRKSTFLCSCALMEQVKGIEPSCRPWQGRVLPLNYTCVAVQTGLEPAISSVTGRHVNHYTTGPFTCVFWRGRRDLNPRASLTRPIPLAGAPLQPLEYFPKAIRQCPIILS